MSNYSFKSSDTLNRNDLTRPWRLSIYLWLFGGNLVRSIQDGLYEDWPLIKRVFSTADAVYVGPVGYSGHLTIEARLFRSILETDQAEDVFTAWLADGNATLVGYCLEGLYRLQSKQLAALPPSVLNCDSITKVCLGSYSAEMTVHELADQIQARTRRRPLMRSRICMAQRKP